MTRILSQNAAILKAKPSFFLFDTLWSSERAYPFYRKPKERSSPLLTDQRRTIQSKGVASKLGKDSKTKKSPKILPPANYNDWRRRVLEISNSEEYQSLSPWLRQLWKGNGTSTSGNVEPSMIGTHLKLNNSVKTSILPNSSEENMTTDDDDGDGSVQITSLEASESKSTNPGSQRLDRDDVDKVNVFDRVIVDPKSTWPIDPNVYPHIRACLGDIVFESREYAMRDTGMHVCTLGTSAGNACRLRSNTCTVVKGGATAYLFDAGEGVQRQFMLSRLGFNEVRKIFITHMHADHVYGLPGLLLSMQVARMYSRAQLPVEIYGPVGLYNFLAMTLALTGTQLRKLNVHVYELQGGTQRSMRFAGNRKTYSEFLHKCLHRKVIPQNTDGTWTLVEPIELTTPDLAVKHKSIPSGYSVKAAEIHHIPDLQCFGYTVQEPLTQPRPLDVEAANGLGVMSSEKYRILKSGFSVMNDDETRLVHPHEVCGEPVRPRKVTILGDCCLVPPVMEQLAMNSDVLIHEGTLSIHETGKKVDAGGHSTAAQAAIFANKTKAQMLVINHLPKHLNMYSKCKEWLHEAESRIRGPTKVQLGYDHLEIMIPRNGFDFNSIESSRSLWPEQRQVSSVANGEHVSDSNDKADIHESLAAS